MEINASYGFAPLRRPLLGELPAHRPLLTLRRLPRTPHLRVVDEAALFGPGATLRAPILRAPGVRIDDKKNGPSNA